MTPEDAVKEYQCIGCVGGPYEECFEIDSDGVGCGKHAPGTMSFPAGKIFLGLPNGFNRLGQYGDMKIKIYTSFSGRFGYFGHGYDEFNVPVWKILDKHKNTIVRGLRPRLNEPFLHIFLDGRSYMIGGVLIPLAKSQEMD